jgi:hypothetical protein
MSDDLLLSASKRRELVAHLEELELYRRDRAEVEADYDRPIKALMPRLDGLERGLGGYAGRNGNSKISRPLRVIRRTFRHFLSHQRHISRLQDLKKSVVSQGY